MGQQRDPSPGTEPIAASGPARPILGPVVLLVAGLIGALAAWLLIEQIQLHELFIAGELPPELANRSESNPERQAKEDELAQVALYQNSTLLLAVIGGCLGACLGLAEGALRRSIGTALLKLLTGALLGAAFGAAGGLAQVFAGLQIERWTRLDPTFRAMAMHSLAWMLAAAGLALALFLPPRRLPGVLRGVLSAISAGLVAGLIYAPLGAYLFPLSDADQAVPSGSGNRLVFIALAAGLIGLALGRARQTARTTA